jgi:ubiquinone/menaquinone biosynthesis C-methylase UbiE
VGDIQQLRQVFGGSWDWSDEGEQWSDWWGGTSALWFGGLLPRIHAFVPTGTILEIAPGYGRWTQYLKELCEQLVVVDLAPNCIEHCRSRFADDTNIEYHVNDGRSLPMIADSSIDFVFTWDSLVHADADILNAYVGELKRILKPDGVAFIHHSNVGAHRLAHKIAMRAPQPVMRDLIRRGAILDVIAWRSPTMSAAALRDMAKDHGLVCFGQEIFNWEHGRFRTEAISMLAQPGSRFDRETEIRSHHNFKDEARRAQLYNAARYANG